MPASCIHQVGPRGGKVCSLTTKSGRPRRCSGRPGCPFYELYTGPKYRGNDMEVHLLGPILPVLWPQPTAEANVGQPKPDIRDHPRLVRGKR